MDVNWEIHEKIKNCDIWLKIGQNFINLKIESLNLKFLNQQNEP